MNKQLIDRKNPVLKFKNTDELGLNTPYVSRGNRLKNWISSLFNNSLQKVTYNGQNYGLYKGKTYSLDSLGHPIKEVSGLTFVLDNNGNFKRLREKPITGKTVINKNEEIATLSQLNPSGKSSSISKPVSNGFREAFNAARKAGLETFNWNGGKYNTMTAAEKSSGRTIFNRGRWVDKVGNNIKNKYFDMIENTSPGPVTKLPVATISTAISSSTPKSVTQSTHWDTIKLTPGKQYDNNWRNAGNLKFDFASSRGMFKKGGQLISKNPVLRFKRGGIPKFQNPSGNLQLLTKINF